MTRTKRDREHLAAGPRGFRCSELCQCGAFTEGLALLADAGGPQPTVAQEQHRELHRFTWALMHRPGGAVPLKQDVENHQRGVRHYQTSIATIEARGIVPDPLLLKSLAAAQHSLDRLTALLEQLPPEASRKVDHEQRRLARDRELYELNMERHRAGSPEWQTLMPGHRELVARQIELDHLGDMHSAVPMELKKKAQDAATSARNAMATSLTNYISITLVKRRDALLKSDSDTYRLFPKAIPETIKGLWREVQRVASLVHRLRGDDAGGGAQWEWFTGMDDALDLAVQEKLGIVVMGRPPEAVGEQKARPAKPEPGIEIGFAD